MEDFVKVTVKTTSDGTDILCAVLSDIGIGGFEICDKADFWDFVNNCRDKYDYIDESLLNAPDETPTVCFYIKKSESREMLLSVNTLLSTLRDNPILGSLELSSEDVHEEDWAETWKKFFHPTAIGDRILIVPEWETAPESDRIKFIINPGMVFGTGTHESTQLCIEAAENRIKKGNCVLDLGCGSGILSIVSMLLGAKRGVAVDIDPASYDTAYANAEKNGITEGYTVKIGDVTDKGFASSLGKDYDVVFANIVSGVIINIAPLIPGFLADDGILITSGIILERREEVQDALMRAGLVLEEYYERRGWCALVMKKK